MRINMRVKPNVSKAPTKTGRFLGGPSSHSIAWI
jgi:hypothetical protein